MKSTICITASFLVVLLANPIPMGAQVSQVASERRYHLVDLGTLGGPNSYLPLLPPYHEFLPAASLSRTGTFAGLAETDIPDPYAPLCFTGDCLVAHAIAWSHGTARDLGALPYASNLSSGATWISKNGLIAGVSEDGQIDPLINAPAAVAVLWNNTRITNLGTLEGGYESGATAVNSAGQVVGFASNLVPDPNSLLATPTQTRAFLWKDGLMRDLGTLSGGTDAMALFINDRGQIVGQSYSDNSVVPPAFGCTDSPLTLYGFFWDKGNMTDMGTLGGSCTFPYSLNNRGEVVGQSNLTGDTTSHPFLWRPGMKMKDLGALGGNYGFAEWLNDAGAVVGTATNPGDQALLAFEWQDDTMTNLGALEGNACSAADAINSQGLMVGGSGFNAASFFPACTDTVEHAVMWDHGQIVDLNTFVPPGSDITLNEAFFVNDDGEIAGVETLSNGDQRTFLLVPCEDNDDECHDAAGYPAFGLGPHITKPTNKLNTLDRTFRHGPGPVSPRSRGSLHISDTAIADQTAKSSNQPLDSSDQLGTDFRSRFEKAPACILPGRQCSPSQNHCCSGKCVFHGGSTRIGYMCE